MKIKLDRENRQVKIDDNQKFNYGILKFVMILNIIQMLMRILINPVSAWDVYTWLIIPIGLFSFSIFFYLLKLSTAEVIPLEEIEHLVHKNFVGRKRLSLKLKNGKTRHLQIKSITEIKQIQNFINSPQKVKN
ncbi:hypothetical protein LB465_00560 [Salegentibacter sp. LM13S]|uniref:hypothetical protein n=1 Tax=Salegentibacter lacus TaxID=2873599 RepID=UPI001CCDA31C|nr:hypothetical protein [Salegentibacter lacus]MBZ9629251.1 hypothetical protein [Salegentibacter lacus]